jgi:hypothetical protein
MLRLALPFALALVTLTTGCDQRPDFGPVSQSAADAGGYPALLPMDDILERTATPASAEGEAGALAARVAALQARAAALRRTAP